MVLAYKKDSDFLFIAPSGCTDAVFGENFGSMGAICEVVKCNFPYQSMLEVIHGNSAVLLSDTLILTP